MDDVHCYVCHADTGATQGATFQLFCIEYNRGDRLFTTCNNGECGLKLLDNSKGRTVIWQHLVSIAGRS